MTDRKKRKNKLEASSNKLLKEEDVIARFIRFNCPTSSSIFEGNEVHYFSGKKAVDILVESKKYGVNSRDPKFSNQAAAEDFLNKLLERGLFFRAKKVVLKKKEKIKQETEKKNDKDNFKNNANNNSIMDEIINLKKVNEQDEERKKKKKVKILFHDIQTFVQESSDVYVWVYDPTPFHKKAIGFLIVLGTIAGCLFPLWPDWLRLIIYYLSITGIALFGLLLCIALSLLNLARTILFGIIYACSFGRHKLWILPNLTEDCGFFESFKPFYTYEYVSGGAFGNIRLSEK